MKQEDQVDFLRTARQEYEDCVEADRDNREEAFDDMQFLAGQQWPEAVKHERETSGRPCLTINRMPQFVRQVTGDIRAANPAIDVIPADGDASEDMAELFNGLIRNIEYQHDASSIYERAAESAASCGIGAFRVYYEDTRRGQEIVIEGIPNPFSVHWDPLAKDPTRKDARYCFITDRMDEKDFKKQYPKAKTRDFEHDHIPGDLREWYTDNTIMVAEYFYREDDRIMWAKISGEEVLEGPTEFPGEHLPVVAVVGEEMHIGDRVVRTSVIRYAKDAQRIYNYWRSAQTELIALQPKSPFILTPKQVEGHERYWNNANNANYPWLPYNPDERAPGAPQRSAPPLASQAMMQEIMVAADDMKATTGIYDAGLGQQGNEKSGVAIKQRQIESDISTSIYVDNLAKSIMQAGRIIVGLIPFVYDQTRVVRIIGADGATALERLNEPVMTPQGPVFVNDVAFGAYDVRIKTGPSYSTQRQEAVDAMMQFAQAFPAAAPIIGDLIARNMDWPGADEMADRLAKMLPPGMKEIEDPTPEEQQAMMQQQAMAQQQQAMQQAAAEAEIAKSQAEASEAQADASKAALEVQEKQLQVAMMTGELDAAIRSMVEQAVAQALMAQVRPF